MPLTAYRCSRLAALKPLFSHAVNLLSIRCRNCYFQRRRLIPQLYYNTTSLSTHCSKKQGQTLDLYTQFENQVVSFSCGNWCRIGKHSIIIRRKMISAFYKFTPCKKEKITRQKNKTEPFRIPEQHLIDNQLDIARLKKQCLKYQREFTFIRNQIERQARLKKENNRDHFEMDRAQLENALQLRSHSQNREQRRKELGITNRELNKKQAQREGKEREQEDMTISSVGITRKINQPSI